MIGRTFLAVAFGLALPVSAQQAAENPVCEVKGENGMVTLLLCPAGLDTAELAGEGMAACGDRKPCGAWVWTDAALVPAEAPDSHDKLSQEAIIASKGVWMNELGQFIAISKD